ncbi:MAG: ABC transporter ATP-binding protein [Chloroflexi bacterium]|nr:ABC transporter ATP-binding protein [Chloroflexota bacterium]
MRPEAALPIPAYSVGAFRCVPEVVWYDVRVQVPEVSTPAHRSGNASARGSETVSGLLRTYLWPFRKRVFLMASLVMLSSAIQVVMPRLIGAVIDGASLGRSLGDLYVLAAIFVAGGVAVQILGVTEAYLGADLGQLATNSVRADVTRHLLTLDREFFASNSPGTLIERVDGDTALLSG